MIVIVIYMLVAFVGLCQELVYLGIATADRTWFDRLGFSETAQDVAYEHVVDYAGAAAIKFLFVFVGAYSYATAPRPFVVTGRTIVSGVAIIVIVLGLDVRSAWRQYRRKRLSEREQRPRAHATTPAAPSPLVEQMKQEH